MKRQFFDDEGTFELLQMQEHLEHSCQQNQMPHQPGEYPPPQCFFPNCHCKNQPTHVSAPGDINNQISFVRGMRELLQQNIKTQVVIEANNIPLLLAVEETLLAARLIQTART